MRTRISDLDPRWRDIERVLDSALDCAPDARATVLDRECAGDAELREAVERMLRVCDSSDGFLEDSPAPVFAAPVVAASLDTSSTVGPTTAAAGRRVGPYRIVREAGRGGMGVVYLAERADDQYRGRVALKLMRDSAWVLADDHLARRFVEERQILASLEHPGIARLLDGGVTDDGSPWFAMEYVEGTPIDRYCDEHCLTLRERLALFCDACAAVAFAHRSLVVHRDLKPSNLLVTEDRAVKLLDFGIAKLLAPVEGAGDTEPVTRTGWRALTPEYASPEQARGDRVGTASDVYSLGVILYELLTGHRPHGREPDAPRAAGQAVPDGHIAPPSTVVSAVHQRRVLRGDLDAIVLTAVRTEPDRRYASADDLAADLRRHLDGLPVSARRDARSYRIGKFVKRNRTSVAAAAAFAIVLIVFAIVTAVQSARLRVQAQRVALERDRAEDVSAFLVDLFRSVDPFAGTGGQTTVREVLDSGAARLERDLSQQPELRADLLRAMGLSYMNLGLANEARQLLERAIAIPQRGVDADEPRWISTRHSLAQVLQELGQYPAAESLYRDVLAWRRRAPGRPHLARGLNPLATVVSAQGRYAEAELIVREALTLDRAARPADPRMVSQSLNNLGNILLRQGRAAEAETAHREAYALRRRLLGDDHPETANSLVNLAAALGEQRRLGEADSLFRRALDVKRARLGPTHVDVATDEAAFARVLHRAGEDRRAEALYRHSIDAHRASRPAGHPRTAVAMLGLGELLLARGEPEAAEPYLRDAERSFRAALPPAHPDVGRAERALAACRGQLRTPLRNQ